MTAMLITGSTTAQPVQLQDDHLQGRIVYIDSLRIIAAFFVIVNHTNSGIFTSVPISPLWFVSLTYFFIAKTAVPIFLMIMGALLLQKKDSPKQIVKRIVRVASIFVIFSAVYYYYYGRNNPNSLSVIGFLKNLFGGMTTTPSYWYLYLYLALLCVLPLLQQMTAAFTKGNIRLLLCLSLVYAGTVPLFYLFTSYSVSIVSSDGLFSVYFATIFSGYYIHQYVTVSRHKFAASCFGFIFFIAFQVLGTYWFYMSGAENPYTLDNIQLIPITGSSFCFFMMIKYIFSNRKAHPALEKAICSLGKLTFGIYLTADFVIYQTGFIYANLKSSMPLFPAMFLWELCIFFISAGITLLLRAIPFLRKWI